MTSQRIAIVASFYPKDGHFAEVERILRGMLEPTRAEPGCRRYDLYRDHGGDQSLHLLEAYDDMAAIEQHRAADYFKAYRAAIADHLTSPVQARLLSGVDVKEIE